MKILIVDKVHNVLENNLRGKGHHTHTLLKRSREEYLKIIGDYDGLVVRSSLKIDREFIDAGKRLKFIARVGAGMENIDTEYAQSKGIRCLNSPEGNRSAVAEHAVGMLLMLFRNMRMADEQIRKGIWKREENRGIELEGKTVGIIGYGNMGSAFAKRLSGFGLRVLSYDKYKNNYADAYTQECEMSELFQECDIVSIHTPLTAETKGMVNTAWINKFEKDIYLINTARGPIVNTDDLVEGLKSGKVAGACLDVLEYESLGFENIGNTNRWPAFNYLRNCQRVVLSPHIAGLTKESNYKLAKVIADKILSDF